MGKEKSKIQVRDVYSQQVLFECFMDEHEKAYKYAAEMEEMGLDVEILAPTLAQTLSHSLGLTHDQTIAYEESLAEEMESHEGGCCFEDSTDKPVH